MDTLQPDREAAIQMDSCERVLERDRPGVGLVSRLIFARVCRTTLPPSVEVGAVAVGNMEMESRRMDARQKRPGIRGLRR